FGAHGGRFAKRPYCQPKISKHYKRNSAAGNCPCGAVAFVLSELSRQSETSILRVPRALLGVIFSFPLDNFHLLLESFPYPIRKFLLQTL
ncbi:MAG: hypothetical protein ACOCN1_03530, partial [Bacteroidales bacterium]